jgi:uncharacterized protein (DUF4213/DUF364 family)
VSGNVRASATLQGVAAPRDATPLERALLARLPEAESVRRIIQGASWVLAVVRGTCGREAAGMAGIPRGLRGQCCVPGHAAPEAGQPLEITFDAAEPATRWARLLLSTDNGEAALGLAVINALLALEPETAAPIDGVDWLLARAAGRNVAVIGGFPFVDRELRRIARDVWVFEREPGARELHEARAPELLPNAEIVVITGSALANHTLDAMLSVTAPHAVRMLLGPSTPLTSALFPFGFDALSGVRVADAEAVAHAVSAGTGFRRMTGLQRVTLLR